jgi:hypothetical protein
LRWFKLAHLKARRDFEGGCRRLAPFLFGLHAALIISAALLVGAATIAIGSLSPWPATPRGTIDAAVIFSLNAKPISATTCREPMLIGG